MARGKRKLGSNIAMYLMLAPYMSLLILFGVVPIIMAVLEVPHESRVNPDGGWDAFKIVLQDFRFLPALKNVLGFMAIFVPLTTVFVIAVALMLDMKPSKWKKWLRLSYIVPASISGAVAVLVWYVIFAPTLSPIKSVLNTIGIEKSEEIWQTKNLVWLFAVMAFFAVAGNWILIQYGSLQSLSQEIIEAARMDGATEFKIYRHVLFPQLSPTFLTVLIILGHISMKVFDLIIGISGKSYVTDVLAVYMWQVTFDITNFAKGASIAMIILFMVAIVVIPYLRHVNKTEQEN